MAKVTKQRLDAIERRAPVLENKITIYWRLLGEPFNYPAGERVITWDDIEGLSEDEEGAENARPGQV